MADKYIKYDTQNIIDFTLTNFGSLNNIFSVISQAGYSSYSDFLKDNAKSLTLDIPFNTLAIDYAKKNIIVSSTLPNLGTANLVCGNDLKVKTLVVGDYNDDFNDDFDKTGLDVVVVGYSGMDMYVTWSITNTGDKQGTATPILDVTGFPTRNISQVINAGETYYFSERYLDVPAGDYTISLTSLCPQSIDVKVLGNAIFESGEDFTLVESEPITGGEEINLTWSVDNTGDATGVYEGVFSYEVTSNQSGVLITGGINEPERVEVPYTVSIDALGTHIFTYTLTVVEGVYTFYSTFGDIINLTVGASTLIPDIVYNNDLAITPLTNNDGDEVDITWSMTNNGTASGETNGYLEVYPANQLEKYSWRTIEGLTGDNVITLAPGETKIFTKKIIAYAGDREIRLTGDAIDTLSFSVDFSGVASYVYWAQFSRLTPTVPTFSSVILTKSTTRTLYFFVYLLNNGITPTNVNVKLLDYNYQFGTVYQFANETVVVNPSTTMEDGTYAVRLGNGTNITGKHKVSLYIDNVFKGDIYFNVV